MKKIKKVFRVLLLLLGTLTITYFSALLIRKIRVVKTPTLIYTNRFKISYHGILKSEAESISKSLEDNYGRIGTELNDPEHDTISVYIHPTQKEFNHATGLLNSKANGVSKGPKILHLMYQTWFNSILPADMEKVAVHEFSHCVQLNILIADAKTKYEELDSIEFNKRFEKEFAKKYPQWFWEALCDYQANIVNKSSVNYSIKKGLSLKDLNKSNQIYNLGHTIVDYMVTTYGKDKLPKFIKSYGDFENVLNVSEKDFEIGWKRFVAEKY
jgi:hypothetical protein